MGREINLPDGDTGCVNREAGRVGREVGLLDEEAGRVGHETSLLDGEAHFTHGLVRLILNELRFIFAPGEWGICTANGIEVTRLSALELNADTIVQ